MVKIRENPIKIDDLVGFPYFWFNTQIRFSFHGAFFCQIDPMCKDNMQNIQKTNKCSTKKYQTKYHQQQPKHMKQLTHASPKSALKMDHLPSKTSLCTSLGGGGTGGRGPSGTCRVARLEHQNPLIEIQ